MHKTFTLESSICAWGDNKCISNMIHLHGLHAKWNQQFPTNRNVFVRLSSYKWFCTEMVGNTRCMLLITTISALTTFRLIQSSHLSLCFFLLTVIYETVLCATQLCLISSNNSMGLASTQHMRCWLSALPGPYHYLMPHITFSRYTR